MRYAFVSDIHGNLPAWSTVLADIALRGIDRIVCLGDVIGYGPEPAECLRSVYSHCAAMVLGNHDAVVGGRLSEEIFNDRARRVTAWTRTRLGPKASELFAKLPLVIKGPGWRCSHGDFADPAAFGYVFNTDDAARSFAAASESLLFVGHTHKSALFVTGTSGAVYELNPQDFQLESGKRYIVNVGSVGSPRDGDPRASYVIYDDSTSSIYFHRVPYDFEAFRSAVRQAEGLDPADVQLLNFVGAEDSLVERNEVDFAPSGNVRASGSVVEEDISKELRRTRRGLKIVTGVFCAVLAALAVVGFFTAHSVIPQSGIFPKEAYPAIEDNRRASPDGDLFFSMSATPGQSFDCPPFQLILQDTRHQSASASSEGYPVFTSDSEKMSFAFVSAPITFAAGSKFETMSRVRFSEDFSGSLTLEAIMENKDGTQKILFSKNFSLNQILPKTDVPQSIRSLSSNDGWALARGTSDSKIPAIASSVRVRLSGAFKGTVTVGAISARLK